MIRATLLAALCLFRFASAQGHSVEPSVLQWTFANGQAVTILEGVEKPGLYWGPSSSLGASPLIAGEIHDLSLGAAKVIRGRPSAQSYEQLTFDEARALFVLSQNSVSILTQDHRLARVDQLRTWTRTKDGSLVVERIYRDAFRNREFIVLRIAWNKTEVVGEAKYAGEYQIIRDDGVSVRFGLYRTEEPVVTPTVHNDILEIAGVARKIDLRQLEAEATVQTGIASRASDARNVSISGWDRATELFNSVDKLFESPRLDEASTTAVLNAAKSLTLGRRSVVLKGRGGVGKRTLARKILDQLPRTWGQFRLTADAMDSASAYAGNFSSRLLAMKAAAETKPIVWFLPNLHAFCGLGTHQRKDTDFFDGILDELKSGAIRVIGTVDDDHFAALVRGSNDLRAIFDVVPVADMAEPTTAYIVGDRSRKAGVAIDSDLYLRIQVLGRRFASHVGEPARTVEVVDYALKHAAERGAKALTAQDVETAFRRRHAVPEAFLDHDVALATLRELEDRLETKLPGNPQGRAAMMSLARSALLGLRPPNRPVGTGLLVGPRGAGKTSLVELFAEIMDVPMLPLAMSGFNNEYTVRDFQRAFGEFASANPIGIVFLDELEKSHEKVQDALLKAMESSRFSYSDGQTLRTAPMTNLIIVGATNAAEDMVMNAARHGSKVVESALRIGVVGQISSYLIDRLDFVEPMYPADDRAYREIVRRQIDLVLEHFGVSPSQIENLGEMIDAFTRERSALGSNREAERATFRGIGDAFGRMMASRQVADRGELKRVRFRFEDELRLECEVGLRAEPEEVKVIRFPARHG